MRHVVSNVPPELRAWRVGVVVEERDSCSPVRDGCAFQRLPLINQSIPLLRKIADTLEVVEAKQLEILELFN